MKYIIFALAFALAFTPSVSADSHVKEPTLIESSESDLEAMTRKDAQLLELSALVEAVDVKNRLLTIKGPDGEVETVKVEPSVKRLAEMKKGDAIVLNFYRSIAFEVREPTEAEKASPGALLGAAGRAPKDEAPAAGTVLKAHGIATITKIDTEAKMVTLKGPEGRILKVDVRDPKAFTKIKIGDTVAVTYTEALAVGIEPAPKK